MPLTYCTKWRRTKNVNAVKLEERTRDVNPTVLVEGIKYLEVGKIDGCPFCHVVRV